MDIETIRNICKSLPSVTEDIKWGDDLCFMIGGKMFCVAVLNTPFKVSFKVSDEEAILLTGAATIAEAAKIFSEKTNAVFAITLGKEGTMLGFNNQTEIIESIPVKPVDTTGAGDAFVGAVLYQLSDKDLVIIKELSVDDWKHIITNANKAGARTCEYLGAMEAFKNLNNQIFQ